MEPLRKFALVSNPILPRTYELPKLIKLDILWDPLFPFTPRLPRITGPNFWNPPSGHEFSFSLNFQFPTLQNWLIKWNMLNHPRAHGWWLVSFDVSGLFSNLSLSHDRIEELMYKAEVPEMFTRIKKYIPVLRKCFSSTSSEENSSCFPNKWEFLTGGTE